MSLLINYIIFTCVSIGVKEGITFAYLHDLEKKGYKFNNGFKTYRYFYNKIRKHNQLTNRLLDFVPGALFYNIFRLVVSYSQDNICPDELLDVNNLLEKKIIYNEDYEYKNKKLAKKESDLLVKYYKFEEVKETLGEGKAGRYDSVDDYKKLEILNSLENNEYDNDSFNNLSRREKIEFLRSERNDILNNHNEELESAKKKFLKK